MPETLLELRDVSKVYDRHPVVRQVSLSLHRGETLGIVGESGCGKSTLAKLILGLEKPTSGEILFQGQRLDQLSERSRRPLRPRMQMVFQDSGSSLNPRKRVEDILAAPMLVHHIQDKHSLPARIHELLRLVGLPEEMQNRYPHELSGGQRQRVCIARALALEPELLVLDEPVSALDVSVQAQVLNLLRDLQQQLSLTCLFIGHGLGAVHYVSSRIAVMYMGQIVELGSSGEVFSAPAHPYTRALLDAAPQADDTLRDRDRIMLKGELTGIPAQGCSLLSRCPFASAGCGRETPVLRELPGHEGHWASCDIALRKAGE